MVLIALDAGTVDLDGTMLASMAQTAALRVL
jgi:hypothetical protein